MFNYKKPAIWIIIAAIVVCAAVDVLNDMDVVFRADPDYKYKPVDYILGGFLPRLDIES